MNTQKSFFKKFLFVLLIPCFIHLGGAWGTDEVQSESISDDLMYLSAKYQPVSLRGIKLDNRNPFSFEFIVDHGSAAHLQNNDVNETTRKLVKYFLAALTIPDENLWVNLSPYEENRIINDNFARTAMGRDMLKADYSLKELSSAITHPETSLGQNFWETLYSKAHDLYGTKDININIFNKIWIMPDKVNIYKNRNSVFIIDARMKVLLEEDYLALKENNKIEKNINTLNRLSASIGKDIILPAIEKEINTGENFSALRQIYHSLILAAWYKKHFQEALFYQSYVRQQKIKGIDIDYDYVKEEVYNKYMKSFAEGIYTYIKEDYDSELKSVIPRKYFSGGANFTKIDPARTSQDQKTQDIQDYVKFREKNNSFSISRYEFRTLDGFPSNDDEIITEIAKQINAAYDLPTDSYNIKKTVKMAGGSIITDHGELWIHENSLFVFIDDRFTENHLNFNQWSIYADSKEKAIFQEYTLRSWAQFALNNNIATYEQIVFQNQLGKRLLEWKTKDPEKYHQLEKQFKNQAQMEEKKYHNEKQKLNIQKPNITKNYYSSKESLREQLDMIKETAGEEIYDFLWKVKVPLSSSFLDLVINHARILNLDLVKKLLQIWKNPYLSSYSRELINSLGHCDISQILKWVKQPDIATLQGISGAFNAAELISVTAEEMLGFNILIKQLPTPFILNLKTTKKNQSPPPLLSENTLEKYYDYKEGSMLPDESLLLYFWNMNTHQMQLTWKKFQEELENFILPGEINAIDAKPAMSDQMQYLVTVTNNSKLTYSQEEIRARIKEKIFEIKKKIIELNPEINPMRIEEKVSFRIFFLDGPLKDDFVDHTSAQIQRHKSFFLPWNREIEKQIRYSVKKENDLIKKRIKKLTNFMGLKKMFPGTTEKVASFAAQLTIHWFRYKNTIKNQNPLSFFEDLRQILGHQYLLTLFTETFYDKKTDQNGTNIIIPKEKFLLSQENPDAPIRSLKNKLYSDHATMKYILTSSSKRIPLGNLSKPQRAKKLIKIREKEGFQGITVEGDYVIKEKDYAQVVNTRKGGVDFNKKYINWNVSTAKNQPGNTFHINDQNKTHRSLGIEKNLYSTIEGYDPVHIETLNLPINDIPFFLEGKNNSLKINPHLNY